jgi:hypothetical protein
MNETPKMARGDRAPLRLLIDFGLDETRPRRLRARIFSGRQCEEFEIDKDAINTRA